MEEVVRATALERTDRVEDLHLAQQAQAEPIAERAADELGRAEKDGIDDPRGLGDPLQRERAVTGHEVGPA
jgi:hypothetical protein